MSEIKQVSLSDQMGVMAVIDGLRHRSNQVQELLDAKKNEALVAEKLRSYYSSNGISVTDDLIDRGVEEYYSKRYVFSNKPLTKWQQTVVNNWIGRSAHIKTAKIGSLFSVSAFVLISGSMHMYEAGKRTDLIDEIKASENLLLDINQKMSRQRQLLKSASEVKPAISGIKVNLDYSEKTLVSEFNNTYKVDDNRFFASAKDTLEGLKDSGEVDDQLRVAKFHHKTLSEVYGKLSLNDQYMLNISRVERSLSAISSVESDLASMSLDAEDKGVFDHAITSAKDHLSKVSYSDSSFMQKLADIDTEVSNIQNMATFAKTPITLKIVNKTGVKAGVERNYNASKGKSWYAIVEPYTDYGDVTKMKVKNVEDGTEAISGLFGVSITHEAYKALKADKLDNGHVDNDLIGKKPADNLKFSYETSVTTPTHFILKW